MVKLKHVSPSIGVFSFFTGAGFLDLGFEETEGFKVLFANEYHAPFMDVYEYSRDKLGYDVPKYGTHVTDIGVFFEGNQSKWLGETFKEAKRQNDLIGFIGGPPCPDFSVGGKNRGVKGENGKLSGTYIELILKHKPDFFLFENVKGLYRTKKHRAFFDEIKQKLVFNDYAISEKLINAIEYGAPQDRERIILIGFRKSLLQDIGFNASTSYSLPQFDWEEKVIYNAKNTLALPWPKREPFIENGTRSIPLGLPMELTVQHWFENNKVLNHPNTEHYFKPRAGLAKFKVIDEGDDQKKSYKRLHRWRYSPTAAYGNNEVHLHPYKARRLSVAETLAIQSLPKDFSLPEDVSLTNMFKTIGNGVPYLAAKGLAETILHYINNAPTNRSVIHDAETISK